METFFSLRQLRDEEFSVEENSNVWNSIRNDLNDGTSFCEKSGTSNFSSLTEMMRFRKQTQQVLENSRHHIDILDEEIRKHDNDEVKSVLLW